VRCRGLLRRRCNRGPPTRIKKLIRGGKKPTRKERYGKSVALAWQRGKGVGDEGEGQKKIEDQKGGIHGVG